VQKAMPRGFSGVAKTKVLRGILKGALFQKRPLERPGRDPETENDGSEYRRKTPDGGSFVAGNI